MLTRKLAITLLFSIPILLAFPASSSPNGDSAHRRDHANLARMIKMRVGGPAVPRQLPGGPISLPAVIASTSSSPSVSSSPPSTSSAAPQSSSAPPAQASSSSAPALTASSSVQVPSVQSTSSASLVSSSSAAATTPKSSSPSSASSNLPSSSTSDTPAPSKQDDAPAAQSTPDKGQSISVDSVTSTSRVPGASATSANDSQIGGSTSLSRTTMTILVVLAASVGGCAIVWTIIRKWKFRPSTRFEDRLEPIDWQPTEHDSGLPTHRRVPSNASSFHSGGHDSSLTRSDSQGRGLAPLPEHDFTAGPATLAPVGGYADLARGPSPQPQMQEALQRGPSFTRGYENYSNLPPHHQGVQDAYNHNNVGAGY